MAKRIIDSRVPETLFESPSDVLLRYKDSRFFIVSGEDLNSVQGHVEKVIRDKKNKSLSLAMVKTCTTNPDFRVSSEFLKSERFREMEEWNHFAYTWNKGGFRWGLSYTELEKMFRERRNPVIVVDRPTAIGIKEGFPLDGSSHEAGAKKKTHCLRLIWIRSLKGATEGYPFMTSITDTTSMEGAASSQEVPVFDQDLDAVRNILTIVIREVMDKIDLKTFN